tara:strand:+ start:44107 stop:44265 length:159 start_codon:yes stop_codon:yes gene_type:complete
MQGLGCNTDFPHRASPCAIIFVPFRGGIDWLELLFNLIEFLVENELIIGIFF